MTTAKQRKVKVDPRTLLRIAALVRIAKLASRRKQRLFAAIPRSSAPDLIS